MTTTISPSLDDYRWTCPISTRWSDNDVYGHINNVVYYSYFDSIANLFLIEKCGLDIHHGEVVGLVVHSECTYSTPAEFPHKLTGALRVDKLGNSSVTYGIGVFRAGVESACAHGSFTHVFVNRAKGRPVRIPEDIRTALTRLAG